MIMQEGAREEVSERLNEIVEAPRRKHNIHVNSSAYRGMHVHGDHGLLRVGGLLIVGGAGGAGGASAAGGVGVAVCVCVCFFFLVISSTCKRGEDGGRGALTWSPWFLGGLLAVAGG